MLESKDNVAMSLWLPLHTKQALMARCANLSSVHIAGPVSNGVPHCRAHHLPILVLQAQDAPVTLALSNMPLSRPCWVSPIPSPNITEHGTSPTLPFSLP
jgi:hypothetical protein